MKHLKKLSVVLMMTILFSVSFTSCIDNEVSPVVEAIYEAQADLIAAQAAVQNAEAALRLAQAQAEEANAAYTASLTASVVIENAYATLENEQLLRELIADTNLAVEVAQNDLAEAQVQFDIDMAELMAELAEAGAVEAAAYAAKYAIHVGNVNTLTSTLIVKKAALALKELMLTGGVPNVSWTFYLAGLNSELATLQGNLAANLAAIEAFEDAMENPTAIETQRAGLVAQIAALEDENVGLAVDIAEAENVRVAAAAELAAAGTWITTVYDPAKLLLTNAEASKEVLVDANEILLDEIEDLELALADYPAALAALQLAATNADTAQIAALAAFDAAVIVQADAAVDNADAISDLNALNAELTLLNGSFQDAIQALADETALFNAGLPAAQAALVAAQADLAAAEAAVLVAQADYDAKLIAFEANPTGFVWTAGANGAVGLHADATTATNSYREVNLTDNGVLALSLSAGAGINQTGAYGTFAAFLADATAGILAPGDYYNVGGDDVAGGTNADRLELAADALTLALDAIAPLEAAVVVAQDFVDNFGDDLAAAQLVYDHQKDLFENQLALVATADALVVTTDAALTAANTALSDADAALIDADAALIAADAALAAFEATTEGDILASIDTKQATVDANLIYIAEWDILIVKYQADLDALEAQHDELVNTPLFASLQVALLEAEQAKAELEAQVAANNAMKVALQAVITSIDANFTLADYAALISALESANVTLATSIEAKKSAIAIGVITVAGLSEDIAALETEIDALEAQIAIEQALADKYKALMDAALAS